MGGCFGRTKLELGDNFTIEFNNQLERGCRQEALQEAAIMYRHKDDYDKKSQRRIKDKLCELALAYEAEKQKLAEVKEPGIENHQVQVAGDGNVVTREDNDTHQVVVNVHK